MKRFYAIFDLNGPITAENGRGLFESFSDAVHELDIFTSDVLPDYPDPENANIRLVRLTVDEDY